MAHADSRNRFEEIIALVNAGDTTGAESLCRGGVARDPRDVNMIALLGAVLAKLRRYEEAEDVLRRAIALAPTFAKPREDLAHVLLETHRAQEAIGELETATRLDPAPRCVRIDVDVEDPDRWWSMVAGMGDDGALLVRPDQHVAFRARRAVADAESVLRAALDALLGRRAAEAAHA